MSGDGDYGLALDSKRVATEDADGRNEEGGLRRKLAYIWSGIFYFLFYFYFFERGASGRGCFGHGAGSVTRVLYCICSAFAHKCDIPVNGNPQT